MQDSGITVIDHLGTNGVVLVQGPDGIDEAGIEARLSQIPGYEAADVYNPFDSQNGEIPFDIGPAARRAERERLANWEKGAVAPSSAPLPPQGGDDPAASDLSVVSGGIGFDGLPSTGFRPPDPTGAAGPNTYISGVNNAFQIQDKATGAIIASASANTIFASVSLGLSYSDPVVVYNEHTQRFAIGEIHYNTSSQSYFVMGISKTSNPTSFSTTDWNYYRFNADDPSAGFDFADYPKMGYNADGYVITFNQFKNASSYDHVAVLAVRNDGTSPGVQAVPGGISHFTLAPASMHDNAPGGPMWFVENGGTFFSSSSVNVVKMTNVFTASPTFTFTPLTVNTYYYTQSPHQPGGQLIGNSNLGTRFYFAGARTVGGVTHLVAANTSGQAASPGNTYSEVRWYDFNITGAPSVIQQGAINAGATVDTYFPDADIAPDGTIGIGYMQSSSTQYLSNYVTGRNPGDPLGSVQTPVLARQSTVNLQPNDRIGDYTDLSVDPVDGSFWYTGQYALGSGSTNWRTWIQHFNVAPAGFLVTSTNPAVGSTVTGSPGPQIFTVDFNAPINLASVQASDFTVDGIGAVSFGVVDADTLTFTLSASVAQGVHTMALAGGVITDTSFRPLNAFSGQFRYDALPLAITGTNPAPNGTLVIDSSPVTVRVFFNEPVNPATVSTADFGVSVGTVSGVAMVAGNQAVDVSISGLTAEGQLTLNIAPNSFADFTGGPNPLGFSATYQLDYVSRAYPTPLIPKNPLGSLIYDPSISGLINFAGDTDSFTLNVDPNQTISILVTPTSGGLRPRVELFDPSNTSLGFASAGAPGQITGIQTRATTTGGTYRIAVSSVGGTTGNYNVQVILNSAFELEGKVVGASNNTAATAQNIDGSFINLDTTLGHSSRGAVLGTADTVGVANTLALYNFESGQQGWTVTPLTGTSLWHLSTRRGGDGGHSPFTSFYYGSDATGNYDFGSTAGAIVSPTISLPSASLLKLDFNYFLQVESGTSYDLAEVQISNNGGATWTALMTKANGLNYSTSNWTAAPQIDISAYAGQNVQLRFYFNSIDSIANSTEGWYVDDVKISQVLPQDYYSFTANAGQSVSLALTNLSAGNVDVQLIGTDGTTVLASGVSGATNLNEAIQNYQITSTGTYYAKVTGQGNVPYSLVVTRNAAFDAEANNNQATAQPLGGSQGALGAVEETALSISTITFSELTPRPVNGVSLNGVTFGYTVGGIGSTDATFGGGGPGTTLYTTPPQLEGGTAGVLTMNFATPTNDLQFGFVLSTVGSVANAATVQLFDSSNNLIATRTINTSVPSGYSFTEALFTENSATPIARAVVTPNSGVAARFVMDNIQYNSPSGIRVAVQQSNVNSAWTTAVVNQLNDDTYFNFTATAVTDAQIDTVAELSNYDVVLLADYGTVISTATAAALKSWVQSGKGGIVSTAWTPFNLDYYSPGARADLDAILPVNLASPSNWVYDYYTYINGISHPVTQGVTSLYGIAVGQSPYAADLGATVLATDEYGYGAVVVGTSGSGRGVYLNPAYMYGQTSLLSGSADRLLEQALAWAAPPSDSSDWYKVTLGSDQTVLEVETRTPADGPGEFVNTLNPKIQLFNAAGTDITPSVTILGDGRNEKFRAVGLTPGATYFVKVSGEGGSKGEYYVSVVPLRTPTITTKVDDGLPLTWGPDGSFTVPNPVGNGWVNVATAGYLGDHTIHTDNVNESASNYAMWNIKATSPNPELFATWVARPSNATNATYQIYQGTTLLKTVVVDQTKAPNDALLFGTTLAESLGTVNLTGWTPATYVTVKLLTLGANGDVVADGVFDPPSNEVASLGTSNASSAPTGVVTDAFFSRYTPSFDLGAVMDGSVARAMLSTGTGSGLSRNGIDQFMSQGGFSGDTLSPTGFTAGNRLLSTAAKESWTGSDRFTWAMAGRRSVDAEADVFWTIPTEESDTESSPRADEESSPDNATEEESAAAPLVEEDSSRE